jgi:hypothetical protein
MNQKLIVAISISLAVLITMTRPLFPSVGHSWLLVYMSVVHLAMGSMVTMAVMYWRSVGIRNTLIACVTVPSLFQLWWFVTNY